MSDRNEDLVREAYEAYGRGDVDTMLHVRRPGAGMDLPRSQPGEP